MVGAVTLTNEDRKAINTEIHAVRQAMGLVQGAEVTLRHLDDPKLTQAQQRFCTSLMGAQVNAFHFTKTYRERGIKENDLLRLVSYDIERNLVRAENADGKAITFSPKQQDYFRPFVLEERQYAVGDQVEARWNIKDEALKVTINNGTRGTVKSVDANGMQVTWHQKAGDMEHRLDVHKAMYIDHAYAHTTFKEQGATTDQSIFAVSETGAKIINQESAYVGVTRARQDTILVTSDMATIEKNVGTESKKTSAFEIGRDRYSIDIPSISEERRQEIAATVNNAMQIDNKQDKTPEKTIDRGLSL